MGKYCESITRYLKNNPDEAARDIPSLLVDQAKQYFLMARTLLKQILLVVPPLRDLRSRTVSNLKAILEEAYKDSEGICSLIEKEKKN